MRASRDPGDGCAFCFRSTERFSSRSSLQQPGEYELWAEPIPRPYARAEEYARALYGRFGIAPSRLWAVLADSNRQRAFSRSL